MTEKEIEKVFPQGFAVYSTIKSKSYVKILFYKTKNETSTKDV